MSQVSSKLDGLRVISLRLIDGKQKKTSFALVYITTHKPIINLTSEYTAVTYNKTEIVIVLA